MKYSILLGLLIGCNYNPNNFEGKCLTPYVYSGNVVKVLKCSNKQIYEDGSNFCIVNILEVFGALHKGTVFTRYLEGSPEVSCKDSGF